MNRKEILNKIREIPLENDEFIILSGASMVVQRIKRKTSDIDVAVTSSGYEKIKNKGTKYLGAFGIEIINIDVFEYSTNLYDDKNVTIIDGIRFANLESILFVKKKLNRDSDKKDIKKLELAIAINNNYSYERDLINKGYSLIAGVDEVGRGPLVGPVVAACVILPLNYKLEGLTDSKKLSEKKREEFYKTIERDAISIGIGVVNNDVIDDINIYEATKLAMKEAISNLSLKPDYVLTDAMKLDIDIPMMPIIKGDLKSLTISAASVIAKVTRDHMMYELDKKYPYYNFRNNKGYPTKDHIEAINKYGIIDEHRKSYGPVKNVMK